jgi:hypothetical protein
MELEGEIVLTAWDHDPSSWEDEHHGDVLSEDERGTAQSIDEIENRSRQTGEET